MEINPEDKILSIILDDYTVNIIQGDIIFPLEKMQSCLPTFENFEQVEILHINFNFCQYDPSCGFMNDTVNLNKLLKSLKKVNELHINIDFNQNFMILQSLDDIINELQHLPIKTLIFQHNCDLLPNIDFFIKYLALTSTMELQDIRLNIKMLNQFQDEEQYFESILQNLCFLISKNQNRLLNLNLSLIFLEQEDTYDMDYQLFSALLQCKQLTNLTFLSNVNFNQYIPLPPSLSDQQLLHLQNLKELNFEFQSYESSRQEIIKELYKICYKNITTLRLVNAIESINDLDIQNINHQLQVFSFYIQSTDYQFNQQDFDSLKQLSMLRNLLHLRLHISLPTNISQRDNNCMTIAKDILSSLPLLLHFEMNIKGFIDSQSFMRFFNYIREKQYLLRLEQMDTTPGLKNMMLERRQLIQTINVINQKDYQYKLRSLFRKDIIIDMLRFKLDLQSQI